MKTAVVADARSVDHLPGPGHVECPARMQVLLDLVDGPFGDDLVRLEPRWATDDDLTLVHTEDLVARVTASADREWTTFDADTSAGPATHEAARYAAGGAVTLLDAIVAGEVDNGLALVRPPGHHAEADRAMGFCFFNNVAVGAEHLRRRHGLERILVLDWDVHHGNGTQHIFEADAGVLYVSLHQFPFYPGTGAADETGIGDGRGATLNVPLPAGCGDPEFRAAFTTVVDPVVDRFEPEFIIISAGFDADERDPLGGLLATEAAYRDMTRRLLAAARKHADGRLAVVLEGGYDLNALREDVTAVADEMRHERSPEDGGPIDTPLAAHLDAIRDLHGL